MKKRKLLGIISLILLMTGCTSNTDQEFSQKLESQEEMINLMQEEISLMRESLETYDQELSEMSQKNQELETRLNQSIEDIKDKVIKDSMVKTLPLSQEFLAGYTQHNISRMSLNLSDQIYIEENEIITEYEGVIYSHEIVDQIIGYSLNSYEASEEVIFYQYILYKENAEDAAGRFFMNLEYRLIDSVWKLTNIEYDI